MPSYLPPEECDCDEACCHGHAASSHPTELKYPQQTSLWREIDQELYKLHLLKNADYSPSNVVVVGLPGIIVRMWDKMSRIFNLFGISFPSLTREIEQSKNKCIEAISSNMSKEDLIQYVGEQFDVLYKCSVVDWSKFKEGTPANEPLDDAFKDMRNYAQIALIFRQGKWGR